MKSTNPPAGPVPVKYVSGKHLEGSLVKGNRTQLSALAQELSVLNSETFEVKDYVNCSEMAFDFSSTGSCATAYFHTENDRRH